MGTDDWSWRISGIVCKWPVILCDGSERRRGRERVGEEWRDGKYAGQMRRRWGGEESWWKLRGILCGNASFGEIVRDFRCVVLSEQPKTQRYSNSNNILTFEYLELHVCIILLMCWFSPSLSLLCFLVCHFLKRREGQQIGKERAVKGQVNIKCSISGF